MSFASLTRHDIYYINGGDLYFLVQTVTFRVHRYFFERESPRFKGLLSAPASPGAQRQGTSDSNAIVLDNVAPDEFAKFLWVFYNPRYSLYHTTPEDWTTILDLSWRWQFGEVKALAVRELEKLMMLDVDRVSIYHKFDVDRSLLIPRYAALCAREAPLSLEEGLKLGLETSLMIARTRELARVTPGKSGARSPTASPVSGSELEALVRDLFDIKGPSESYESGYSPIGENSNAATSFAAAGQAFGAPTAAASAPAPAPPVTPKKQKNKGDKVSAALNGNNDINSPPRPKTPPPTASTKPAAPVVPAINTSSDLLNLETPATANPSTNPSANGDAAPPADAAGAADADASTTEPVDGQATTTEGEAKSTTEEKNDEKEGKAGKDGKTEPEGEASAISKTSAANEAEETNTSRSASPTRGSWLKRTGKGRNK